MSKTKKPQKVRADLLLIEKGLVPSRERAKAMIMAGRVLADGRPVNKAGEMLPKTVHIEVKEQIPYVGWGGVKLKAALDHFCIDVAGKIAADFGASTGGFTHCLILNGAEMVYAVDVGYGQLDPKLREHPQVVVMEKTNVRHLSRDDFERGIELITADLSFISLTKVITVIWDVLVLGGEAILLIKPQFEVGREHVGKGGIVKDPAMQEKAVTTVALAAERIGFTVMGSIEAPRQRDSKNREFLLYLRKPRGQGGQ